MGYRRLAYSRAADNVVYVHFTIKQRGKYTYTGFVSEHLEKLGKSARDDGSIIMEDNNWFCGDHISGFSVKTMKEF